MAKNVHKYPECFKKDCHEEMKPIMLNHKMIWECPVHGLYNKMGKKINND